MTTQHRISCHTFNCKISQFDLICPRGCKEFDKIVSDSFIAGEDIDMKSKWSVMVSGRLEKIGCFLALVGRADGTNNFETVRCSYTLSLGNDENKQLVKHDCDHTFALNKDWGAPNLISIAELYEKEATLLQNNTLQICVQMQIYSEHRATLSLLPLQPMNSVKNLQNFSAIFLEMYTNKKNCDVEIVCDTETFHCHKVILSARSTVFSAMFESQMQESTASKVTLTETDASTLQAVLLYMYSGKVEVNDISSFATLVYAAEKYDVLGLKEHCFDQMIRNVTDDTIGNLAVAARNHNADNDTKKCIKEYCQRNIVRLLTNAAFKNLVVSHPTAFF